ncbi:hypothetical protein Tco_1121025 [Tanacetum coccineum]|uniref:Uncharacterized protein n=1 Tax=Tanacetum coccineum TaxID=301880 RepID=A0ABQ5IY15_9ASTR
MEEVVESIVRSMYKEWELPLEITSEKPLKRTSLEMFLQSSHISNDRLEFWSVCRHMSGNNLVHSIIVATTVFKETPSRELKVVVGEINGPVDSMVMQVGVGRKIEIFPTEYRHRLLSLLPKSSAKALCVVCNVSGEVDTWRVKKSASPFYSTFRVVSDLRLFVVAMCEEMKLLSFIGLAFEALMEIYRAQEIDL